MKNFLTAVTALILFVIVLCVKGIAEPPIENFSQSEIRTLGTSAVDVINFVEGRFPIGKMNFVIDKNILKLKVAVEKNTSAEKLLDVEEELKREILHAVIDNGYLEESIAIISKLKIEVNFEK